ncbi:MAG TPA: hypothetical protein VN903_28695 [Polyangia bacterium]|nr:hypothetical protein [Polyangia bacterium]
MASHPTFSETDIRITLRDRQQLVADYPYQTTKYAGSNVLPAGLEGVADLLGKPKPVCYGVVKNVPAPCVNTSKLIYQVSDSTINSVDAVYDRGIGLHVGLRYVTRVTGSANDFLSVTYGGGLFVAAGAAIRTSPDGVTWTARTPSGAATRWAAGYGNGLYLVAGITTAPAYYLETSPDGITWTSRTTSFGTSVIRGIAYGAGVYVAVAQDGKLESSADGITWTARTSGFGTDDIIGVVFALGLFVIVGANGKIATSPDGITWTMRTSGTTQGLSGVTYGQQFVACGGLGVILTSPDGLAWTTRDSGTTISLYGAAYGDGRYAVTSSTNTGSRFSDDGIVWTNRDNPPISFGVAFGNHCFVVAQSANIVSTEVEAQAYASQADLLDDTLAPAAGTFKYLADAGGSYFRLGSKPDGLVTCDATQGANAAARTAAQIWSNMLLRNPTLGTGDRSATDLTTLDGLNSAVCGDWQGTDETTIGAKADLPAQTVGAGWWNDATGVFRIARLTAPSGTAALTLTQNEIAVPLQRVTPNDPGNGVPNYKITVRYGRYYATLTTDLAGGVDDASRAQFAQEWRDKTESDSGTLTNHPLSQPIVIESLFSSSTDADTEATRVLALRIVKRDMYDVIVQMNSETMAIDIGSVIALSSPRFGLSVIGDDSYTYAGLFRVLDVAPDAANRQIRYTVWGKATGYVNVIGDDTSFVVGDDGSYLIGAAA